MWSLYYYNFKHHGVFAAYKITLYKFISSLFKILLSLLFFQKKIYLIHKYRLKGLINAYRGKTSWLRPDYQMEKDSFVRKIKFKLSRWYHILFGEKFNKKLNFEWEKYPSRHQIIQETIIRKNYKNYLEIGCDQNQLFSQIEIEMKVGVDPVSGGTVRATSDNFFKNNIIKFDIIFIDGLHEYNQVKKDIKNSLSFLNDDGVIFLHDCMPTRFLYQAVPRASGLWNGDVWKNIVETRTMRELDTYVIFSDHGLGMILKRPNKNLLNIDIKNFKNLKFKDYYYNYENYLNVISVDSLKNIF